MIFPNAAQTYPIGNHLFTKPWTKSIKTEPRTAHIVWLYDLKTTKKVKAPIDCRLPFHHKPSTQPHLDQIPLWSWYMVLFVTLQFAYMQIWYIYRILFLLYHKHPCQGFLGHVLLIVLHWVKPVISNSVKNNSKVVFFKNMKSLSYLNWDDESVRSLTQSKQPLMGEFKI